MATFQFIFESPTERVLEDATKEPMWIEEPAIPYSPTQEIGSPSESVEQWQVGYRRGCNGWRRKSEDHGAWRQWSSRQRRDARLHFQLRNKQALTLTW